MDRLRRPGVCPQPRILSSLRAGRSMETGSRRHQARVTDICRFNSLLGGRAGEISVPTLSISPADHARGEKWLAENGWKRGCRIIGLHPGAGSISKRWPLQNFRELAARIIQSESQLLAIEGPAEQGAFREMTLGLQAAAVVAAKTLPLGALAAALSWCAAFVGNDSGIAHLAAALGVPSVVLFGPTSPEQWAPHGKRVRILRTILGCRACERQDGSEHTCMAPLSVDSVWSCLGEIKAHRGDAAERGEPRR